MPRQTDQASPHAAYKDGSGHPAASPGSFAPAAAQGTGRSARKRQAIMDSATALFLRDGYRDASMDQIAAAAVVSKQTVYKNFADKEQLFREIVLGVTGNATAILTELTAALNQTAAASLPELQAALTSLARRYLDGVLEPRVLALRRLIIAEAERFPDLARTYFEQAPARAIRLLAPALEKYNEQGLLTITDPSLAAAQFAYLALAIPQDKAQFCPRERPTTAERDRFASEASRIFLAAYACRPGDQT